MEALGPEGVYEDRGRLYTVSACPGRRVYGERLLNSGGTEYREWDPHRSKLAAYIAVGGRDIPLSRGSGVLYLGASSGTTPSHVADIVRDGRVVCVEFAPRMFRELVRNCEGRSNMMPVLGDATKPSEYSMFAEGVTVVYQDVAQKRQADIACDNMDFYNAEWGMVAVKARSEDVTAPPERIFDEAESRIRERGYRIVDARGLGQYEKDHEMIVFRRQRGCPGRATPWPSAGTSS
ncbi:MAG: fibrillarin-like rRNA/tRNA 2'-O-methyltransferase [Thermoplasmata archaeon]|nr:fibrillarin-like rRNA/tRNA 2'-O-methyltransferase [Thermoplasmata archaeon]